MSEHTIFWEGIGEIKLRKNQRAKKMNLRITDFNQVKVTVPRYMSFKTAEMMLKGKREWMLKTIRQLKKEGKGFTRFDHKSEFSTKWHVLNITQSVNHSINYHIDNGLINITYPNTLHVYEPEVQQVIRKAIDDALEIEAYEYLPIRVKELADKNGFSFHKLTFRNTSSQWGSCSSQNNISLNIQLMRLPNHLIDYVILHELVHTVHHNHSAAFWNLLDQCCNNRARALATEMKKHHTKIY